MNRIKGQKKVEESWKELKEQGDGKSWGNGL